MKGTTLIFILALVGLVTLGAIGIGMYFTYNNKYVALNNSFESQVKKDEVVYDNLWKSISQIANIADKYQNDFRENYKAIISARNYGGEMMKWITEQNPNFDISLYSKLANVVEAQRAIFLDNQNRLNSIHMEMNNLVQQAPSSFFLGGRTVPELHLVTSAQTDAVFQTHREDSVKLF